MTEVALIVCSTVVILALLTKHEAVMRRQWVASELGDVVDKVNAVTHYAGEIDSRGERFHKDLGGRLEKLERQVNQESLGKALGRR